MKYIVNLIFGGTRLAFVLNAALAATLAFAVPDNLDLGVPVKADQIVNRETYECALK